MSGGIEIVQSSPEKAGPGKPFGGQSIFDLPGAHIGFSRLGPGATTPWHHHAACEFFAFVYRGTVTLEFGPGGRKSQRVTEGQFARIPPGQIHRDVNDTAETVLIVTACLGEGPTSALVETPDG